MALFLRKEKSNTINSSWLFFYSMQPFPKHSKMCKHNGADKKNKNWGNRMERYKIVQVPQHNTEDNEGQIHNMLIIQA